MTGRASLPMFDAEGPTWSPSAGGLVKSFEVVYDG
jgi:hypothetical protein